MMLAGDDKNSVLCEAGQSSVNSFAYSAYGHRSEEQPGSTHLGYNGELREAHTGWYLLGNGYRAFNPLLMRFHSPDSWSPFGEGGMNAYMYVLGNPIQHTDPTGHFSLVKFFSFTTKSSRARHVPSGLREIGKGKTSAMFKKITQRDVDFSGKKVEILQQQSKNELKALDRTTKKYNRMAGDPDSEVVRQQLDMQTKTSAAVMSDAELAMKEFEFLEASVGQKGITQYSSRSLERFVKNNKSYLPEVKGPLKSIPKTSKAKTVRPTPKTTEEKTQTTKIRQHEGRYQWQQ
ncbi:RHS repeat-associated core domain-containing protein [Pseudomonas fluorescens]|uniref:RHS repeat-associated core domain-containing protein n=1 Tax=Pseudomonas fluorescens TaxID=294 RepID=UPI001242D1AF|nr:RHS repeat-associated core domain-containing protein [Pseudomonas fluorescens]VVN26894.1 hypothetical protein PS639_04581 [Pseudomonas fluorescens]